MIRYYQITKGDNPDKTGDNSWYIMTNLPGKIQGEVAQIYSLRNWIEYGFKQVKNELGWSDYRLTDYHSIERWWELVFSAYLVISMHANNFQLLADQPVESQPENSTSQSGLILQFQQHPWWEDGTTWKSALNNLRLMIQPYIFYCLISPWLTVFKIPGLRRKFYDLIYCMDDFLAIYTPFPATSSIAA